MKSQLTRDLERLHARIGVRGWWCKGTVQNKIFKEQSCVMGMARIVLGYEPTEMVVGERLDHMVASLISAMPPINWTKYYRYEPSTKVAWFNDHHDYEDVLALVRAALARSRAKDAQVDAIIEAANERRIASGDADLDDRGGAVRSGKRLEEVS